MATFATTMFLVDDADTETDWTPSQQVSVDTENQYVQRSTGAATEGAITFQTSKNGITSVTLTKTAINMTANVTDPHLYWSMRCDVMPLCEPLSSGATNSGMMLRVTDSTANFSQWHIAGSFLGSLAPTYEGGIIWGGEWRTFVLDLSNTANLHSSSGTLNLASVTQFQFFFDATNSGNFRAVDNTWIDAIYYGEGLQVRSTTTENVNFNDFFLESQDETTYYGVMPKADEVFFPQGKLTLGITNNDLNFNSSNEVLFFRENPVDTALYAIIASSEGTGTTNITIDGLVTKTNGTSSAELDFSAISTGSISVSNSNFIDFGTLSFSKGSFSSTTFNTCGATTISSPSVNPASFTNVTWTTCGQVTKGFDGTITNSSFNSSSASVSLLLNGGSTTNDTISKITDTSFTSDGSNHAIQTAYSLGAADDIEVTWKINLSNYDAATIGTDVGISGSPVTGNEALYITDTTGTLTLIVPDGYSAPSVRTDGATINVIEKLRTFEITNIIQGTEIRIYDATLGEANLVELAGAEDVGVSPDGLSLTTGYSVSIANDTENAGRYVFTYQYTYSTDTPIIIAALNLEYEFIRITDSLVDENSSIQLSQVFDRQYDFGTV